MKIYLWECALSPHLGNILVGMVRLGYEVHYVVESDFYAAREKEGWVLPEFPGVSIMRPASKEDILRIINGASYEDVHICVGLRANTFIRKVTNALRRSGRRFLVFMETISETGLLSFLKKPLYRMLFLLNRPYIEGVLAAGASAPAWVESRGVRKDRVFHFAYFLSVPSADTFLIRPDHKFRLLFVGSLISRKRVHLAIESLADLPENVMLDVVGDGPLRASLETLADAIAPGRVVFHGTRSMPDISGFMSQADCLVLPSEHDGWGAVASEAMLVGTPVVCSDRCGVSVVVKASGRGEVFQTFIPKACSTALRAQVAKGRPDGYERAELVRWSYCLGFQAGAAYLDSILQYIRGGFPRPLPPWDGLPVFLPESKGIS